MADLYVYNRNSGLLVSLAFGSDKLIAFTVDIDDFNRGIVFQVIWLSALVLAGRAAMGHAERKVIVNGG